MGQPYDTTCLKHLHTSKSLVMQSVALFVLLSAMVVCSLAAPWWGGYGGGYGGHGGYGHGGGYGSHGVHASPWGAGAGGHGGGYGGHGGYGHGGGWGWGK